MKHVSSLQLVKGQEAGLPQAMDHGISRARQARGRGSAGASVSVSCSLPPAAMELGRGSCLPTLLSLMSLGV